MANPIETLLERLANDRFTDDPADYPHETVTGHGYIRGWNACSKNAEAIVKRWASEQRVVDALAELERNAP